MRLRNILAIVLTVLCVAMLAGCDEQGKAGSGSSSAAVALPVQQARRQLLWISAFIILM